MLDTNILIYQLNGTIDLSEELLAASSLNISTITTAELFAGTPPSSQDDLGDYLGEFNSLPLTDDIAELAGTYHSKLDRHQLKDLLIASTAQLHNLHLVTANKKDFKGLPIPKPIFIEIN